MPPRPGSPPGSNQQVIKKPRYASNHQKPKPAKSNAAHKFQFPKKAWPNGADGFLKACTELIRMAWGLSSATAVPQLPGADVIAEFNRMREGNPDNNERPPALALPQRLFNERIPAFRANPDPHNRVLGNLSNLEDYVRSEVASSCQRHGLAAWRPDFRASPESPYNETHRLIWENLLDTLITMGAFAHHRIDHKFLKDKALKRKQFNHFVFFRMRSHWKRELTKPGVVEETAKSNVLYKRRTMLKSNRLKWCESNGLPRRQERTCEDPAAHSDDELVELDLPNLPDQDLENMTFPLSPEVQAQLTAANVPLVKKKVYLIRQKPFRSARFTKFFMNIDAANRMEKKYMRKRAPSNIISYPRIRDITAPEAQFPQLPENVPLDYFEPEAFNSWPISMRRKYVNARIAFPLNEDFIYMNPTHESMKIKEKEFMEKYGNEVRLQYHLPADDEEDEEDEDAYTADEE